MMNKRINQLAKQANIDVRHIEKHADEEFEEQLEKFAELIIRECMETTIGFYSQDGRSAYGEIKERFGVE